MEVAHSHHAAAAAHEAAHHDPYYHQILAPEIQHPVVDHHMEMAVRDQQQRIQQVAQQNAQVEALAASGGLASRIGPKNAVLAAEKLRAIQERGNRILSSYRSKD